MKIQEEYHFLATFLLVVGKCIVQLLFKETQDGLFSPVFIPLGRIPMLNEKHENVPGPN